MVLASSVCCISEPYNM